MIAAYAPRCSAQAEAIFDTCTVAPPPLSKASAWRPLVPRRTSSKHCARPRRGRAPGLSMFTNLLSTRPELVRS